MAKNPQGRSRSVTRPGGRSVWDDPKPTDAPVTARATPAQAAVLNAGLDHPDHFYRLNHAPWRFYCGAVIRVSNATYETLLSKKWIAREPRADGKPGLSPQVNPKQSDPNSDHYSLGNRHYVTAAGAAAVGREQNPALLAEMDRRLTLAQERAARIAAEAAAKEAERLRVAALHKAAPAMLAALKELADRLGPRWFLEQNWADPLDAIRQAETVEVSEAEEG